MCILKGYKADSDYWPALLAELAMPLVRSPAPFAEPALLVVSTVAGFNVAARSARSLFARILAKGVSSSDGISTERDAGKIFLKE